MRNYPGSTPTAAPQYLLPEKDEVSAQSYLHTPRAGALVPLQQAVITGTLVGLIILLVCIKTRFYDGWFWALVIALLVTLSTWLVLQSHWFELTSIHKLESLTGLDLDHDGQVGEPTSKRHSVQVNISTNENGNYNSKSVNLPIDENTLSIFATGLLAGRPFSEREWTGNGRPLSVNQFREMRSEMLKRGLICLVNQKAPQQGFRLTRAGQATMQYFSGLGTSPPRR